MVAIYSSFEQSWIYLILFGLFAIVCFRAHGNFKFVGTLARDLVEVRERTNIFDDTVRETSFLLVLIILTCCSGGVLLEKAASAFPLDLTVVGWTLNLDGIWKTASCSLLVALYIGGEWLAYTLVGNVFSDRLHTWMWVRGFTAGIGLAAVFMFPLSLVSLTYPEYGEKIADFAFFLFILVKIAFIYKGFRIFFTESSSWVVFLYYLCSLEIAPLIITFDIARVLAG